MSFNQTEFTRLLEKVTKTIQNEMFNDGWWQNGQWSHNKPTVADINNGYCEAWANTVEALVPEAIALWIDDIVPNLGILDYPHKCINWNNKFYDSECWNGVSDPMDLPFCKRKTECLKRDKQNEECVNAIQVS